MVSFATVAGLVILVRGLREADRLALFAPGQGGAVAGRGRLMMVVASAVLAATGGALLMARRRWLPAGIIAMAGVVPTLLVDAPVSGLAPYIAVVVLAPAALAAGMAGAVPQPSDGGAQARRSLWSAVVVAVVLGVAVVGSLRLGPFVGALAAVAVVSLLAWQVLRRSGGGP